MRGVTVKEFFAPPIDRREILRYMGALTESPELALKLDRSLEEALPLLRYSICFKIFDVCSSDGVQDLTFTSVRSELLEKSLHGCTRALVFVATVGVGIDRLIAKYSAIEPSRALIMQAIGTERVEALCDEFCREAPGMLGLDPKGFRSRISPGYGDLPLLLQRDIFAALGCPLKIGVSLRDSLIMSPSKSVSAIIGIRE